MITTLLGPASAERDDDEYYLYREHVLAKVFPYHEVHLPCLLNTQDLPPPTEYLYLYLYSDSVHRPPYRESPTE